MANAGVVAHELSHGVKQRLVQTERGALVYADWPTAAVDSYRSDDEGLADFFAAVATQDPNFIGPSIPERDLDRHVSRTRYFTVELADDIEKKSINDYDPYPLGSALAAWLWTSVDDDPQARLELASVVMLALQDLAVQ